MRRHRGSVFRLLRSNVGDADAAVDLTQQSFIAAFSALHSNDGERPFRLWISRIAFNKARDWARRRAVRRLFTFARPIEEAWHTAYGTAGAAVELADRQGPERTRVAIDYLPAITHEGAQLRSKQDENTSYKTQ